jgi:hypothetical protein
MENMILTWENLQRRGWQGPGICALCKKDLDTSQHLMLHCTFSQQVWTGLLAALKINTGWKSGNLQMLFKDWCHKHPSWHMLPSIICWNIWLERNTALFEEGQPSIVGVIYRTLGWLRNSKKKPQPISKTKLPPKYCQEDQ